MAPFVKFINLKMNFVIVKMFNMKHLMHCIWFSENNHWSIFNNFSKSKMIARIAQIKDANTTPFVIQFNCFGIMLFSSYYEIHEIY